MQKKEVRVAMVGKYFATGDFKLNDSYLCVLEALKHAGAVSGVKVVVEAINAEDIEKDGAKKHLTGYQGIIVPQGWGSRGVEGKLATVKYAREEKIPYLGLCFGMQMAVIEYARNILGLKGANSSEVDPTTKYPVVHVMPEQEEYLKKRQYGGTIRLGSWPCKLKKGSLLEALYYKYGDVKEAPWFREETEFVHERHRHRYEVNNDFRERLEKCGLVVSGTSPDGELVEAIEISDHPFFVATQFHPEYISRPLTPHPLFVGFVKSLI